VSVGRMRRGPWQCAPAFGRVQAGRLTAASTALADMMMTSVRIGRMLQHAAVVRRCTCTSAHNTSAGAEQLCCAADGTCWGGALLQQPVRVWRRPMWPVR